MEEMVHNTIIIDDDKKNKSEGDENEDIFEKIFDEIKENYKSVDGEEIPEEKEDPDAFEVTEEKGIYIVSGPGMDRLIQSVNFEDQESLNWFHRTLRRLGVIDALKEAGAKEGSTVQIADMEFDFIE